VAHRSSINRFYKQANGILARHAIIHIAPLPSRMFHTRLQGAQFIHAPVVLLEMMLKDCPDPGAGGFSRFRVGEHLGYFSILRTASCPPGNCIPSPCYLPSGFHSQESEAAQYDGPQRLLHRQMITPSMAAGISTSQGSVSNASLLISSVPFKPCKRPFSSTWCAAA